MGKRFAFAIIVTSLSTLTSAHPKPERLHTTPDNEITFTALTDATAVDEQLHVALQACHFASFQQAYAACWSPEQETRVRNKFVMHMHNFQQSDQHTLVVARQDEKVLGWMLYKQEPYGIYVALLCVTPTSCNKGIGTKLVSSLLNILQHGATITLVCRKMNQTACSFYEHLGFVKTDFMASGYSAEEYQGYEKQIS